MSGPAYYNENKPYVARWLRNLIAAGHIAPGEVDERSIEDVRPDDLRGFTQCHFFAGIGVWSLALRRAGWPDDRPVWTGSCPCQPFSTAGKGAGFADERHLWPSWHHLIRQRRPPVILGEQVASKDADPWLDLVQDDLEAMDYAFGAVPFPAASVGAPHIRDRIYWVADSSVERQHWRRPSEAHADRPIESDRCRDAGWVGHTERDRLRGGRRSAADVSDESGDGALLSLGDTDSERETPVGRFRGEPLAGATRGFWRNADWTPCRDGKSRPVEPGTFPLAHGAPARVGRLRAYGNAIVAPQAEAFIRAYLR